MQGLKELGFIQMDTVSEEVCLVNEYMPRDCRCLFQIRETDSCSYSVSDELMSNCSKQQRLIRKKGRVQIDRSCMATWLCVCSRVVHALSNWDDICIYVFLCAYHYAMHKESEEEQSLKLDT